MAAVARRELPEVALAPLLDPDAKEVLILTALAGAADLVVEVAGANFHGVVGGSPEGALLHHAAWVGGPGVVATLIAAGADPTAVSDALFSTPLAWAAHGSQYHRLPERDYVAVAELLVAAGAALEPRFLELAEGELVPWLEERLGPAVG